VSTKNVWYQAPATTEIKSLGQCPDPRVPPEKSAGTDRARGGQKSWAQAVDHDAVVAWPGAAGLASG
jgi:hypothetical protein